MDAQPLSWDDLAYLVAVARHGSLTGAAEALGVHHATVHRRIARLEATLGARLFDRAPNGYTPTAVGEEALEHAQRIEEQVLALERAVLGRDLQLEGDIRVTSADSMADVLAPHLRAFRALHPRIRLSLDLSGRMFDLARREADVAIRPVVRPPDYAVGRRVCGVTWAVYGRADADAGWVGYTEELAHLGSARWIAANVPNRDVVARVSTVPGAVDLARHGLGRIVAPCFLADRHPELRRLSDGLPDASTGLWLLVHAEIRGSARVRAFVDFLWDALRAMTSTFEGTAR